MSEKKKPKKNWATLPLTRVSTIMRSSPRVNNVSEDAVVITAKAAELFLAHLALTAHGKREGDNLDYNDVAEIVEKNLEFSFLRDIIPRKITVREYRRILQNLETNEKNEKSDDKCEQEASEEEGN